MWKPVMQNLNQLIRSIVPEICHFCEIIQMLREPTTFGAILVKYWS